MKKAFFGVAFAAAALCLLLCSACRPGGVDLRDTTWTPAYANNASGDEVDAREVYNAYYSNYQGSLTFSANGTFELWMSPGDPGDGTHSGTYEVRDDTVNVLFDDDTQSQFDIVIKGETPYIVVPYGDYTVYFSRQ